MPHFFRYEPDGIPVLNMLLIRIVLVAFLVIAYRYRANRKLLKSLLFASVAAQAFLLGWYIGDRALLIKEGLPLYHCRIAAIMMAVGCVLDKPKLSKFFAWLGLIGAMIAFVFPDPSPYTWPHLTNITFIVTHYLIAMTALMIISDSRARVTLKDAVLFTVSMNVFLSIVNALLKSNYGYLVMLPKIIKLDVGRGVLFAVLSLLIAGTVLGLDKLQYRFKNRCEGT